MVGDTGLALNFAQESFFPLGYWSVVLVVQLAEGQQLNSEQPALFLLIKKGRPSEMERKRKRP